MIKLKDKKALYAIAIMDESGKYVPLGELIEDAKGVPPTLKDLQTKMIMLKATLCSLDGTKSQPHYFESLRKEDCAEYFRDVSDDALKQQFYRAVTAVKKDENFTLLQADIEKHKAQE